MVKDGRKVCVFALFCFIAYLKVGTVVEVKGEVNAVFQQFDVGDFLPLGE